MTRAAVFGTGSWGTAFAAVLADAGTDVVLCGRDPDLCDAINRKHENPDYHPGIELPATLKATTDAEAALAGADFVVLAIPSQVLRSNLGRLGAGDAGPLRPRVADEGHRARHRQADERGHRRGRRRCR